MTAQEIKSLRLKLGWTRSDLARRLGCSCESITKWETEIETPSTEILQSAQALGHLSDMCADRLIHLPEEEEILVNHGLSQVSRGQMGHLKKD